MIDVDTVNCIAELMLFNLTFFFRHPISFILVSRLINYHLAIP